MEPIPTEEIPPLESTSEELGKIRSKRKVHLVLVLTPVPLLERVKIIQKFPRHSFRFLFLEKTDRKESLSQKIIEKAAASGVNGRILILFHDPLRISSKLLACLEKDYSDTYTLNLATLAKRSSLEDPQGPEVTVVKDLNTYLNAMDTPEEEEAEKPCRKPWNRWYAIAVIIVIVVLLLLWFFGSTMTWVALLVGIVLIVGIWWLVSSGYEGWRKNTPAQEY